MGDGDTGAGPVSPTPNGMRGATLAPQGELEMELAELRSGLRMPSQFLKLSTRRKGAAMSCAFRAAGFYGSGLCRCGGEERISRMRLFRGQPGTGHWGAGGLWLERRRWSPECRVLQPDERSFWVVQREAFLQETGGVHGS